MCALPAQQTPNLERLIKATLSLLFSPLSALFGYGQVNPFLTYWRMNPVPPTREASDLPLNYIHRLSSGKPFKRFREGLFKLPRLLCPPPASASGVARATVQMTLPGDI